MHSRPFRWATPVVLALALVLTACAQGSDEVTPGISGGDNAVVVMGRSRQYRAHFDGVPDDSIVWSIDAPNGATIDKTGLFTAGISTGQWHIEASDPDDSTVSDTLIVTIVPWAPVTSLGVAAYGVAVSSTGVIASADNSSEVHISDHGTDRTAVTGGLPVHVAFSPDGATLYSTAMGGEIFKVDVATGAIVDSLATPAPTYNLAVRPTDGILYVTTQTGWLLKLDPSTLTVTDSVQLASASNGVGFTPDGATLWASTIDAGVVYRIDPATLTKVDTFVVGTGTQRVAIGGDSIYIADQDSDQVAIIQPSTGNVTKIHVPWFPHGVGISADGSKLYVAQEQYASVAVYDRATMTLLGAVGVGGYPRNLAAIPGTSSMLVSTEYDLLRIDAP